MQYWWSIGNSSSGGSSSDGQLGITYVDYVIRDVDYMKDSRGHVSLSSPVGQDDLRSKVLCNQVNRDRAILYNYRFEYILRLRMCSVSVNLHRMIFLFI